MGLRVLFLWQWHLQRTGLRAEILLSAFCHCPFSLHLLDSFPRQREQRLGPGTRQRTRSGLLEGMMGTKEEGLYLEAEGPDSHVRSSPRLSIATLLPRSHGDPMLTASDLGPRPLGPPAMAFLMKHVLGDKLKNMGGGGGGDETKTDSDGKETAQSKGMSREEFEEYQRQLVEEKIQRDKDFATRKAERANLRVQLRDKYRLPEVHGDDSSLSVFELAKMVEEDEEEEEAQNTLLGKIQNLDLDFDSIKSKAQSTLSEAKQAAEEKCAIM
ncbi:complexin-4-like [Scleropages formosus]|uniref:Complexin-4-like n=1 Tax=Scleropages formosus TaxID=113540 RepID=A0A0P7Y9M8_SCLFO|nr:complexin-4-like [Scleropages formosus]